MLPILTQSMHRRRNVVSSGSSYSSIVLADSPVAYWRLGESSGTNAADNSGNSHDGTYGGTYTLGATGGIAGDADTAVLFGGGNVSLGSSSYLEFAGDFTWESWIKINNTTLSVIFGAYSGGAIGWGIGYSINAAGKTDFYSSNAGSGTWSGSSAAINDNAWHHIAVVLSGEGAGAGTWYVDGSAAGTFSFTRPSGSGATKRIAAAGDASSPVSATLDEVAVYGSALSAGKLLDHYNAGI